MISGTRLAITVLGAAVVGLTITLGVVLATDDDGPRYAQPADPFSHMMMMASGLGDSGAMMQYMRGVLGDEAYNQMLAHMAQQAAESCPGFGTGMGGMMHQMMDGMMRQMPVDSRGMMPGMMYPLP